MDIATAKTLVSVILVFAILFFTLFSLEMAISQMRGDLKAVRAQRDAAKGSGHNGTPEA